MLVGSQYFTALSYTKMTNRLYFSVYTRDVFYVRREVDLMKTAKVNAYIMHIFGKIEFFIYTCNLKLFQNTFL